MGPPGEHGQLSGVCARVERARALRRTFETLPVVSTHRISDRFTIELVVLSLAWVGTDPRLCGAYLWMLRCRELHTIET
jgi:hypothetical protein